jgi:aspartyl-tRNA(Asn)/glutamyl-tRNA(Gln) amidotransferase subunit C
MKKFGRNGKVKKMAITKKEMESIAMLARLKLSDGEKENHIKELNTILKFIESLNQLDTQDIDITVQPIPVSNVFREDVVGNTLEQEQALQNAPDKKDGHYRVPSIM